MRRLVAVTAAGALLAAAPVTADTGHGPLRIEIARTAYSPADLSIVEGDLVIWEWRGPDTNHSVTADDGQAFTFDSDPDAPPAHAIGATYAVTFDQPGTWTYHCRVHPSMTGRVVVARDGIGSTPSVPKLTNVRTAVSVRRLTVRYALDEPARIRLEVRRASGGKVLRTTTFGAPPGAGRRTMNLAGLAAGRYGLTLVALDASTGTPAEALRRTFRLS